MDTTTRTTVSAGPEYWLAPVPAAQAPMHDFGDPQEKHDEQPDEHRAFEASDFGSEARP